MVNRIGTARGDVLVGSNRDDYFEPRGVSQRPPGTNETDLIDGLEGFDSMSVSASSSCSFVGSAGTGNWTVFSSNGDTNVSAVGIEEVYFQGSNEGDVFNTGNATGTIVGGGLGDIDIWIADFGARSGNVRFGVNSAFDTSVFGMTVTQVERINLTTGSGKDVISGGLEGDTIVSGAGDDRVDAGRRRPDGSTATDVVDCGAGHDTLIVNAQTEAQSVQIGFTGSGYFVRSTSNTYVVDAANTEIIEFFGGSGDDIVNTGAGGVKIIDARNGTDFWTADLSAAEERGIEYRVAGPTFRRDDLGIQSVDGIDRINLTTSRFDDSVVGGAAGDTVIGGRGDDRVDLKTRQPDGSTATDFFDGGAGVDLLIVDASNETLGVSVVPSGPGFVVRSTSNRFAVDAANCEQIRFTGGSGDDFINTGAGGERVDGNGGLDFWTGDYGFSDKDIRFILPSGGGGSATTSGLGDLVVADVERISLTTGSGNDTIVGGANGDTVVSGGGRDVVDLKSRPPDGSTATDFWDAGGGVDTLIANLKQETLAVSLTISGPGFFVQSISNRFAVEARNCELVDFTGGSGGDTINTGGAGGRFNGSLGIDRWIADFSATNKAIKFALGEEGTLTFLGVTSVKGIEAMTFTAGGGNDRITGGAFADTITGGRGDDTIDGGQRGAKGTDQTDFVDGGAGNDVLVVDASAQRQAVQLLGGTDFSLRSSSNDFFLDTTNVESVRFTGGFKNDLARGGARNDDLNGKDGNDTLDGGLGKDSLDGNVGKDTYRFSSAIGDGNVDLVLNFTAKDDVIELDDAIFTELTFGKLLKSEFRFGQPQDGDDHILVLNQRQLYYDPDGNGKEQAVLFAQLVSGSIGLSEKDFVVI